MINSETSNRNESDMEESAQERSYREAKEEIELIDVLIQPKDIADEYRLAAKKMKEAGNYQDAAALTKEYLTLAKKAEEDGREALYQKACETMQKARETVEYKLAQDMFERVKGYKDADSLAQSCREKNRELIKKKDIRGGLIAMVIAIVIVAAAILSKGIQPSQETTERTVTEPGTTELDATE